MTPTKDHVGANILWTRDPENVCICNAESYTSESGMQLRQNGMPLKIGIAIQAPLKNNPEPIHWKYWISEDSVHVLDSLTWGDI